jgi:hypothetical protein
MIQATQVPEPLKILKTVTWGAFSPSGSLFSARFVLDVQTYRANPGHGRSRILSARVIADSATRGS